MESMSDGIMIDSRQPQITKITTPGRYLADPTGFSFDWELTATPSGIAGIQYAIGENPNGTGLTWQEASLLGSQKVSGLNLTDGGTYYIYLKTQSTAAHETNDSWSASFCSDPLTIDTTSPQVITITTPADGQNSRHFLLQWEARDTGSGITEYRYTVGSTRGGTDVTGGWVYINSNKNNISFYRDDLPLNHNSRYFIAVMAKNGAGLWSPVYQSKAVTVDLTPPVITQLEYGAAYLRSLSEISGIRWAANDPESGIQAYRIQLVQTKNAQGLNVSATLTNQSAGVVNLAGLNLQEAKTYYIAMQFQNGVGDWSGITYSNGFIVDTVLPVITIPNPLPELVTNSGQLELPYEISEPGTVAIQLTAPNGKIESGAMAVQDQTVYSFNQTLEGKYVLMITPTDLAGNIGKATTQIIRLNAKPLANIGPDLVITKGATVHFNPEVSDTDGRVVQYQWDLGNGETSNEAKPSCTYKTLGDYMVTFIVTDNDGKQSEIARQHIKVTNTNSGELTMDENWYGAMEISGDIIVPHGKVLTMTAGTQVTFTGNYQIKVFGKLIINGTAVEPVIIGDTATAWNGIRLESCDSGSQINYAIIKGASAGLVVHQSQATISGCTFKSNKIGLHVIACNPAVLNSSFNANLLYGVKEDDNAAPTVTSCVFSGNAVADYYEDQRAIISMDTLNGMNGNSGNSAQ
jgi:PKD repeat protein